MDTNTPICDFVKKYACEKKVRLHMPGHKGVNLLGFEEFDITEIYGADALFEADGIIAQSEQNASEIFGTAGTFYSCSGSTLCIQAMLAMVSERARKSSDKPPIIVATRNSHKAFVSACGLLGIEVCWVYPKSSRSVCECIVTADMIADKINSLGEPPCAVYITSPDYLGNLADIEGISRVCQKSGTPFLVDNAHGGYLKFLASSCHPIDLGADLCCDSAHKTLPALTGASYLHVAKGSAFAQEFCSGAKGAMAMFGSTSPSYLVLCSLDYCNFLLQTEFTELLTERIGEVAKAKDTLLGAGYELAGNEPMKITVMPNGVGRSGTEVAKILRESGYECEYSDFSSVVLMCSPYNKAGQISAVGSLIAGLPQPRVRLESEFYEVKPLKKAMSIRNAMLSPSELIGIGDVAGRICAKAVIACPPGIPVAVSGEVIDDGAIAVMRGLGIASLSVVRE